jgi:hypothetical protein
LEEKKVPESNGSSSTAVFKLEHRKEGKLIWDVFAEMTPVQFKNSERETVFLGHSAGRADRGHAIRTTAMLNEKDAF